MEERLRRFDEPVLLEMEAYAAEKGFPIVGRNVGVTLEVLARATGAQRIMELGSGFGYSAYWHARAVGSGGKVHLTDGDPENEVRAAEYLKRAGLADRVEFQVGDAIQGFESLAGDFDIVFNDIDKDGYPAAWRAVSDRIRPGGLYVCDNVLWYGRVAVEDPDDARPALHGSRPRAQWADRRGRALPLDDRAHPRRRHGGDPDRLKLDRGPQDRAGTAAAPTIS